MKILIDPVHTSEPHRCAGNYKMQEICRHLLEQRDDVFFYYLLPKRYECEDSDWGVDENKLIQDERIKYIYVTQFKDRYKEFLMPHHEWYEAMLFHGSLWDVDVVITSRMTMIPHMQILKVPGKGGMTAGNGKAKRCYIIGVDNQPMIPNKGAVPNYNAFCDLTVSGHLNADRTYVMLSYFKNLIVAWGKHMFSLNKLIRLKDVVQWTQPHDRKAVYLKDEGKVRETASQDKPFTIAYTQRFDKSRRRTDEVLDLMQKNWIFRSREEKPVRLVVSSVSKTYKGWKGASGFEMMYRPRDEFLRMMHDEVDVVVGMSIEEGYSLAMAEPVYQGTPVIILRRPWSESLFGADYPFFVDTPTQAYSMIRKFYNDYAGQYAIFRDWVENTFRERAERGAKEWLGVRVQQDIEEYERKLRACYEDKLVTPGKLSEVIGTKYKKERGLLKEKIIRLSKDKHTKYDQATRVRDKVYQSVGTGGFNYALPINIVRQDLIYCYGYKDMSTEPGDIG